MRPAHIVGGMGEDGELEGQTSIDDLLDEDDRPWRTVDRESGQVGGDAGLAAIRFHREAKALRVERPPTVDDAEVAPPGPELHKPPPWQVRGRSVEGIDLGKAARMPSALITKSRRPSSTGPTSKVRLGWTL